MKKRINYSFHHSSAAVLLAAAATFAWAQAPSATARAGAYTADQAKAGEAAYTAQCASCHGAQLEGRGPMPALQGKDFITNWKGMSVGDLGEKIHDSMPADKPGTLTLPQNASIVAYLLKQNGYPAGATPLPPEIPAQKKIAWGDK